MKTLSIIVPARNEEAEIANTIHGAFKALSKFNLSGEVIAVNDGSTDQTAVILKDLQLLYPSLMVITHLKSQGLGAAFLSGIQSAKMDYAFLLPGDNENDPESVMIHVADLNQEDVLVTYVENPEERSAFRQKLSRIYTHIINLAFGHRLKYFNGTSLYKVSVIKKINLESRGFFFTAEILLKLLRGEAQYKEVPIRLTNVKQTKSQALSWKSLKEVMKGFCRMLYWQYVISRREAL
nr:glycosyltransferase family 2 protein [Bacteriovorax sp. HI3]